MIGPLPPQPISAKYNTITLDTFQIIHQPHTILCQKYIYLYYTLQKSPLITPGALYPIVSYMSQTLWPLLRRTRSGCRTGTSMQDSLPHPGRGQTHHHPTDSICLETSTVNPPTYRPGTFLPHRTNIWIQNRLQLCICHQPRRT